MATRTVLVTGGAGFIGSHRVEECVRAGHEVIAIDDLSTGERRNLRKVRDRIDFREMDLRSGDLGSALEDVDWVLHQAALPSVEDGLRRTVEWFRDNPNHWKETENGS